MTTTATQKAKVLTVLDTVVESARRVRFTVLSSNGIIRYETTFDKKTGCSCTCPGCGQYHKLCYHLTGLAAHAQALLDEREAQERAIFEQLFDPCGLNL
jgi:hypothetical protein